MLLIVKFTFSELLVLLMFEFRCRPTLCHQISKFH